MNIDISGRLFKPWFALAIGVAAVSTGAIFARMADAPALVIAAYRVGLAAAILAPIALWKVRKEILALAWRDIALGLLAGFFLALHFATWISSLDYTPIANSVVLVNTNPLWVGLLTPFITGDRIKPATWTAICGSVIGCVIIGVGDLTTGGTALFGDFLALMGGVCAALYLLMGRNLRKKLSLLAYITICYGGAAIFLWIAVLASDMQVSGFSANTTAAFWAMALIPQLIGHTSYNWSLKWFSTSLVAVSLLGEPICCTIMGWFIFGEGLSLSKVIGGTFILSAIYLAAIGEKQPKNN